MKKIAKLLLAVVILTVVGSAKADTYPAVFVVHEINRSTDTLTLIDYNGWMWDVYGVEDFEVGDVVGVIMDDVGTEIIYDDEVQSVRYCGQIDQGWR